MDIPKDLTQWTTEMLKKEQRALSSDKEDITIKLFNAKARRREAIDSRKQADTTYRYAKESLENRSEIVNYAKANGLLSESDASKLRDAEENFKSAEKQSEEANSVVRFHTRICEELQNNLYKIDKGYGELVAELERRGERI